ncbi:hypothetical protein KKF91_13965 [Myxococcota bacterium]|nr:hypothetical protein [Myxococcota bacterium]
MRPIQALLHPAWWLALLLLILNDHVFKGAHVLPSALTGKLSDLAGLFVAPALLAALLGVRSSRGWRASHVAVGVVFAAINLSRGFADAFSALIPWRIWVDPTDLIALPMLWLSAHHLGAWSSRRLPTRPLVQRLGLAVGGLACLATSPPDEPYIEPPSDPYPHNGYGFQAPTAVRNNTSLEQVVTLRRLNPNLNWRCEALRAGDTPIPRALFSEVETHQIPPNGLIAVYAKNLDGTFYDQCELILIEGAGFKDKVLFLDQYNADNGITFYENSTDSTFEIKIEPDQNNKLSISNNDNLNIFDHIETLQNQEENCQIAPIGDRLNWDFRGQSSKYNLVDIQAGLDGCYRFKGDEDLFQSSFYICSPLEPLFQVGDEVHVIQNTDSVTLESGASWLTLRRTQLGQDQGGERSSCGVSEGVCGLVKPLEVTLNGDPAPVGTPIELKGEALEMGASCNGTLTYQIVRAEAPVIGSCDFTAYIEEVLRCEKEQR